MMTQSVTALAVSLAAATFPTLTSSTIPGSPVIMRCHPRDPMCRAIAGALIARGRDVRIAASPAAAAAAAAADAAEQGALALWFVEEERSATHIMGHLAWVAADGRPGRGDSLRFDVSDATITDAMLANYAGGLVHATPVPD